MPSPVASLKLVMPPTSGIKMVRSSKVKQQRQYLSLLLECLMLEVTVVRSPWTVLCIEIMRISLLQVRIEYVY